MFLWVVQYLLRKINGTKKTTHRSPWLDPEVETADPQLADLQAGNILVLKGLWAKAEGMRASQSVPSEALTPGI